METLLSTLKETYSSMVDTMAVASPKILAATIVLVAGLLAARTVKAVLHHVLAALRFETFAERIGITGVLQRADVQPSASEILGALVYWTFLTFAGLVSLRTLGFADASTFAAVGAMIPQVVIAVAILVLGLNVSAFLSKLIQTAAVNAEVRQARFVRNAAHYGMGTLVVILALQQLGISSQILGTAFTIFFGGTCLALAIAFGLGSRELAGEFVHTTLKAEQEQARNLSEASELGNQVFPSQKLRARVSRARSAKTASA
jgi:hypothetical protein